MHTPVFGNPPSTPGLGVLFINVIFFAFAVTLVILRLWARRLKATALALNGYAMVLALVREWQIH